MGAGAVPARAEGCGLRAAEYERRDGGMEGWRDAKQFIPPSLHPFIPPSSLHPSIPSGYPPSRVSFARTLAEDRGVNFVPTDPGSTNEQTDAEWEAVARFL